MGWKPLWIKKCSSKLFPNLQFCYLLPKIFVKMSKDHFVFVTRTVKLEIHLDINGNRDWSDICNSTLQAAVNFINNLRTNFSYETSFRQLFSRYMYVKKQRSYEKFVRKMLMKLTPGFIGGHWIVSQISCGRVCSIISKVLQQFYDKSDTYCTVRPLWLLF